MAAQTAISTHHGVQSASNKLEDQGAATSLKYARAQDLPSYPSTGGVNLSAAGAAASLAETRAKSIEAWKPGATPAASKAALAAKDYEMDPAWSPVKLSQASSKAALQAHRDAPGVGVWKAPDSEQGQSAASHALYKGPPSPGVSRDISADSHRKALLAASGAMSGSRRRAESAPIQPPRGTASWALKAATSSHLTRPRTPPVDFTGGDPGSEARWVQSMVQNMAQNNAPGKMYTSNPPVSIEVEEKNRQDMLRASAVAMARKMYAIQQSHIDAAKELRKSDSHSAANHARRRTLSDTSASVESETKAGGPRYENLEEAARRLAQERLARLHDEHAEYRSYYVQHVPPPRSRLSLRPRRRTSSLSEVDNADEEQSREIRSQMSLFQTRLAEVDSKKRQADRDALLEVAHRNVSARMNAIDEQVYLDTGRARPEQRELWERQARERAQRDSDERMMNVGKIHIGGGVYLEQAEVDAIAKARLQPTLDDITEKAEKQRARDEELRLEQEKQKAEADKEKAELKAANERERAEAKARQAEEKRARKEEAAAGKERARQEKEEKRKSREKPGRFSVLLGWSVTGVTTAAPGAMEPVIAAPTAVGVRPHTAGIESSTPIEEATTGEHVAVDPSQIVEPTEEAALEVNNGTSLPVESGTPEEVANPEEQVVTSPPAGTTPTASPTKGESRVKSWFRSRFRTLSKTQNDLEEQHTITPDTAPPATAGPEGAADHDTPRSGSVRDVALAGRTTTNETEDLYGASGDDRPVSPHREDGPRSVGASGPAPSLNRSVSPISSTEADGGPKVSTDQPGSETFESDSEPRGRKGFRQRFLNKVKPTREEKVTEPQLSPQPEPDEPEPQPSLEPASTHSDENEDFEEARDTFVEETLAPPSKLSTAKPGSPVGSREGSKFTEDL